MHIRRTMLTMLGFGALALGGCETTTSGGADRSQLMLIASQQLDQMAAESYDQVKAQATSQGVLNQDAAMVQRVRAITARLAPHTGVFRADAPGWNWQVNVIDSEQLNAFCMPGGRIIPKLAPLTGKPRAGDPGAAADRAAAVRRRAAGLRRILTACSTGRAWSTFDHTCSSTSIHVSDSARNAVVEVRPRCWRGNT